jgi:hypothetical protein
VWQFRSREFNLAQSQPLPQFVLQAQKGAELIGVEHPCIALGRLLGQRAGFSFGAGIVDRDIQPAEAPHGLFDKIAHIVFVAHIRQNESGFRAEARKLVFERRAFELAPAGYNDSCAFFAKESAVARPIPVRAPVVRITDFIVVVLGVEESKPPRLDRISWRCARRRR